MFQTPSLLLTLLLLVIFVLMRLAEDNLPEEQAFKNNNRNRRP